MKPLLAFGTALLVLAGARAAGAADGGAVSAAAVAADYAADFQQFWATVDAHYAYFDNKAVDWRCVQVVYAPRAARARNDREFIRVLEEALAELYDPHAVLNVNLASSARLIPSQLDVWAEWRDGHAIVTQLRPGGGAASAGLRPGMEVLAVNDVPIAEAVAGRRGRCMTRFDAARDDWALLAVLAGTHDTPRAILVRSDGQEQLLHPDAVVAPEPVPPPVIARALTADIGYIAINDLNSPATVPAFDAALAQLRRTRGLLLDLRDTPAGGSTDVAEPILGRFIRRSQPYQRFLPRDGQPWERIVAPRGPWTYEAPVVVLVSRWTGSMGEGMAIGLDGMHRATVVGTRMAGLNGEVFSYHLAHVACDFSVPGAAIAHLDGTPREDFVPPVLVDFLQLPAAGEEDPILQAGRAALRRALAAGRR
jgi:C-terminal processing protease CtpA/Prc